jgi:hypothetical protein
MECIFVNPVHGNEPYVLGGLIAKELASRIGSDIPIVMPDLYGTRQKKILLEEGVEAILDPDLGGICRPMLFKAGQYDEHLDNLVSMRNTVEKKAKECLKDKDINALAELNIGSRISVGCEQAYYAFPCINSELLQYCINSDLGFEDHKLERARDMMKSMEEGIIKFFIPSYNTLSFDKQRKKHSREISTPVMKPVYRRSEEDIPQNSVYLMISGTDSEVETVLRYANEIKNERNVIVSLSEHGKEFVQMSPHIISHPNIEKVFGRAGWGTIWMCQNADKKFEHLPYSKGDDPEIYFNIKTLESLPLAKATAQQRKEFGNQREGIVYTANLIAQDMTQRGRK